MKNKVYFVFEKLNCTLKGIYKTHVEAKKHADSLHGEVRVDYWDFGPLPYKYSTKEYVEKAKITL